MSYREATACKLPHSNYYHTGQPGLALQVNDEHQVRKLDLTRDIPLQRRTNCAESAPWCIKSDQLARTYDLSTTGDLYQLVTALVNQQFTGDTFVSLTTKSPDAVRAKCADCSLWKKHRGRKLRMTQ